MGRVTEGRGLQGTTELAGNLKPLAFYLPRRILEARVPAPLAPPPASFSGGILLCPVQVRPRPRRMARPGPLPDSAEVKQKAS